MTPHYTDHSVTLYHGDCLNILRQLPDQSVDAVCTDPPYGLGFMGKEWDSGKSFVERKPEKRNTFDHVGGNHNPTSSADASRTRRVESVKFGAWCELWAAECLRVLKPGGHLLAFGGTRTYHRLACAVEDAGFEIRDSIAWLYGSGFPKSLDVSKAIDKAAGAEREPSGAPTSLACEFVRAGLPCRGHIGETATSQSGLTVHALPTAPATDAARQWQGWGTALKPAFEPVIVARKPLVGTVAGNVTAWGTGALNVDTCRIGMSDVDREAARVPQPRIRKDNYTVGGSDGCNGERFEPAPSGRWPANVILDESQAAALDQQSGESDSRRIEKPAGPTPNQRVTFNSADDGSMGGARPARGHTDSGGASRFFYVAAADASEPIDRVTGRPATVYTPPEDRVPAPGLPPLPIETLDSRFTYTAKADAKERIRLPKEGADPSLFASSIRKRCTKCGKQEVNVGTSACACLESDFQPDPSMSGHVSHPTVKPLTLMRWLVRLVTPPGGLVLEPFAGSGTTVEACILEGFHCIAIEREADYLPLIVQRVNRQRDPIAYTATAGEDLGLFELFTEGELA